MATRPNIDLYTAQTPNGIKISVTLEELGLPYTVHQVDIPNDAQKEPWFTAINPNGRIPAITDTFEDGKQIRLFESGSIMQYLVATYDKDFKISFPPGTREYWEMNNWLFFMNAGVGPMQGQANHFHRYAAEDIPYGRKRYQNETRRLYSIVEKHLRETGADYLVGNKCTIADIAHWGWITIAGWAGVDIKEFPLLDKWDERMLARPAVEKGRHVPVPHRVKELLASEPEKIKEYADKTKAWIAKGMKADEEKHK